MLYNLKLINPTTTCRCTTLQTSFSLTDIRYLSVNVCLQNTSSSVPLFADQETVEPLFKKPIEEVK